ncbi:MAG: flagellar basal body rod protein FlgC [Burkholderiales bacterium]
MDFSAVFDISAAGMNLERMRLEATAANLANAQTTGTAFRPLRAVAASGTPDAFDLTLAAALPRPLAPAIVPGSSAPRMVLDPGHPDADARGFVAYPDVSPVSEMVRLVEIGRAYEANVRALGMARSMALKALEIGSER